jgi:hypothetical protein
MTKLDDGREVNLEEYSPRYKYNIYSCRNGHRNLAMLVDEGVTPMFLSCRRTGCSAWSESAMFPEGPPPQELFPVRIVSRKPTKDELRRARRDNFIDHYTQGGLALEWHNKL